MLLSSPKMRYLGGGPSVDELLEEESSLEGEIVLDDVGGGLGGELGVELGVVVGPDGDMFE